MSMTMKRCKSCGQSLSNEDRISHLPEALLLQILSLLPTKKVVAMSVLAKRWRYLWKMVPNLEFIGYGKYDPETFSDNVCRCLLSHQAPFLQSLHLEISVEEPTRIDIGILVAVAFGLHVRKLVLRVYVDEELFKFPRSLYNCETLETLELLAHCGSILVDVPSPVCLKSLRTLHLHEVSYKDDESVLNLLSGCINLENLVVNRCGYDIVKTFTIAVPSLQRLTLIDEIDDSVFEINAPSLKYLKIDGSYGGGRYCMIENASELVEAKIVINEAFYENILGSITSVKRLSLKLSPLEITFPTGSIFYQLAYLELCTFRTEWWNLLTLMLDTAPNLQVLKLTGFKIEWENVKNKGHWGKWNKPKNVPECLLLHLETFVWTCYEARKSRTRELRERSTRLRFSPNERLHRRQTNRFVPPLRWPAVVAGTVRGPPLSPPLGSFHLRCVQPTDLGYFFESEARSEAKSTTVCCGSPPANVDSIFSAAYLFPLIV